MIGEVTTIPSEKEDPRQGEWLSWVILLGLVILLWCAAYNRWTPEAWHTPIDYTGDTTAEFAFVKAMATGEIMPILPKNPASLGAPFAANWNDYPTSDEAMFAWWALLVPVFGLFAASNVALLSAHLLSAASFYFVCRILRYHRIWAMTCALLFSMSPFAFARNLPHLMLTFYWHVPLGILVAWWCVSGRVTFQSRKRLWACVAVAVLHGIQNPYYTGLFLQFLAIAAVVCLVRGRGWGPAVVPLLLIGVALATVVLMNVDTLYSRLTLGPNYLAVIRNYSGVEFYALKPLELFLPYVHRVASLQNWVSRVYFSQTMLHGEEFGSSYLGIVGGVALVYLVATAFWTLVRGEAQFPPSHLAGIGLIFAFSVVGGINGFLGVFGFVLFRCSNRLSIVILTLVLLFLVRELSRLTRAWRPVPLFVVAVLIALLGLWDQVPFPPANKKIARAAGQVAADRRFVASMEGRLPKRAMVFELPVWDYPEVPPVGKMLDYEHFRPYLYSRSLRFSYGSVKGRTRERWQEEVMLFGSNNFIQTLESYGFSAILVNKKAYPDRAASFLLDLGSAGRADILAESQDLICISLHPVLRPGVPPEFDRNWYMPERNATDSWRWSSGNATIALYNLDRGPKKVRLTFRIETAQPRSLDIYAQSKKIYSASIDRVHPCEPLDLVLSLRSGKNELSFRTDRPGELSGNGDARKLAFNIRDFKVME